MVFFPQKLFNQFVKRLIDRMIYFGVKGFILWLFKNYILDWKLSLDV